MNRTLLILFLFLIPCSAEDFASLAMKQPGIDLAKINLDDNSCMIGIQPSTTATEEALQNAIGVLISEFGKAANETGYTGKLQIGITDSPGRVVYMLDISARDAITHTNDTEWLISAYEKGQTFRDDTRNYDPYGNRYTPFPEGKGVLGSMVMPWLGYVNYGNDVWFDPVQRRPAL